MGILRTDRVSGLGGANAITGSAKFFGSNYISVGKSSDFALGTGDWTVEYWAYPSSVVSYQRHFYLIGSNHNNIDGIFANSSGISFGRTNVWAPTQVTHVIERWNHYALVHDSTNMRLYINGTQVVTSTDNFGTDSEKELIIGYSNSTFGGNFDGYISNFRIENGFARYTSAFTPPNTRLTKTENTTFLGLQSSGNVLQEETGKIITLNRSSTDSTGPIASKFTPNTPVGFSTTTDVGSQYGATFDGFTVFATSTYMVPPGGNTRERNRGRAIFAGGARSPGLKIQVLDIASGGIAQDFGDLLNTGDLPGSASSTTRMLVASGYIAPASSNVIEFITIADIASSTDFGDLTEARRRPQGLSNSTRGAFVGGQTPTAVNTIDFVTIATAGNAADFGDTNAAVAAHGGAVASSTRGVYTIGGHPAYTNTIEFITIATTGNGQDFGDLTVDANRGYQDRGSICDTTRGIFSGGFTGSNVLSNTIEFITMATTGNSTNFGDLPVARRGGFGTSNSRLAIFAGGYTPGSFKNAIDQVTIQTTGNATDFGDLVFATQESSGSSDSHGGL